MKSKHLFTCCFVFLILAPLLSADLNLARDLDKAGKSEEAFKHYKAWLSENISSPEFTDTLIRALELSGGIDEEIQLLSDHLYSVNNPSERHTLLKRLALLEEYSGSLADAQMHYELASFVDPKNRDFHSFLSSALILFEIGDVERSEAQAKTLIRLSPDIDVSFQGKLLLARTYSYQGMNEEVEKLVNELADTIDECCGNPHSYFTLYELAHKVENTGVMQKAQSVLNDHYPNSVETALLSGKEGVELYPSPGRFLTLQDIRFQFTEEVPATEKEVSIVAIQTGSFTVKENAEYMMIDLQNDGFSPALEETDIKSTRYYKVLIPDIPINDSQNMMIRLKEKGFEGFMVFP